MSLATADLDIMRPEALGLWSSYQNKSIMHKTFLKFFWKDRKLHLLYVLCVLEMFNVVWALPGLRLQGGRL